MDNSKIGIGIITCGIRELSPNIIKYNPVIFEDKERKGAAYCRNILMKQFYEEGKDYIFIFDDDCYPVIDGWIDRLINWMKVSNVHYLAGLDTKNVVITKAIGSTCISSDCYIGAYFFMDRKCIETIGYYNTEYIRYGYEDITYSRRALAAGLLGTSEGYPFPVWINMYIHSMDMFGENPTPNMSQEEKEKYIKMNNPIFHKEMGRIDNKDYYYGFDR